MENLTETRTVESLPTPAGISANPSIKVIDTYGVGIDTHSKFIQVCVLCHERNEVRRYERDFTTDWDDLLAARQFVLETIRDKTGHDVGPRMHYTIESTGCYHMPVVKALEGSPRIINPLLAGAGKRKTDVLDARTLAHQDITGMWPASFQVPPQAQALREHLRLREQSMQRRLQVSNRLNGLLLRCGHTVGAYAKVTGSYGRALVEDMIAGNVPDTMGVCPEGIPDDLRGVAVSLLQQYDLANDGVAHALQAARAAARSSKFVMGTGEVLRDKRCSIYSPQFRGSAK